MTYATTVTVTALCAALLSAAILVPAPLAVLPVVAIVAASVLVVFAVDLAEARAVLRARLSRRDLLRLRRELARIPETPHPLEV